MCYLATEIYLVRLIDKGQGKLILKVSDPCLYNLRKIVSGCVILINVKLPQLASNQRVISSYYDSNQGIVCY